jgi:gas vesicle protein
MRIRTGRYARQLISDYTASNMLDDIKSYLRNEEYSEAVEYLLESVHYRLTSSRIKQWVYDIFWFCYQYWIIIFICVIFILSLLIRPNKSAEAKLKKIKDITDKYKDKKKFVETTCIICLDELEMTMKQSTENTTNADIPTNDEIFEESKQPQNSINDDCFPPEEEKESEPNDYPNEEEKESFDEKRENKPRVFKATLECGHTFHSNCISEWMTKQNKCPVCREKIDKEEENTKPLSENLINVHTTFHPVFNNYTFNYEDDCFTWTIPRASSSSNSSSFSWSSAAGGASSSW